MREPLTLRLYRLVLGASPAPFRLTYADEATAALGHLLADERTARGAWAARRTWLRAMVDAVRTVWRERQGSPNRRRGRIGAGLRDDVVYVLRSWRHAKAFALTSIVTVALGLGLNAGIFSFADGFLFRPLPFQDPDRLFALLEPETMTGGLSLDDFDAIVRDRPGIVGVAEWSTSLFGQLERGGHSQPVMAFAVTPRFDEVMGFHLLLGRPFRADEHRTLAVTPCWLSYEFWRTAFGGDSAALGEHLRISQGERVVELEVVGVLPPTIASFDLNNRPPELVIPEIPIVVTGRMRELASAFPMVRLAPDVTPAVAQQRLQATVDAVQQGTPRSKPRTLALRSVREMQVRGGRPTAWLLFAIGLAVLLLVVVNLTQLFLARTVTRSAEIAIRLALGSSRWRIARLLLIESLSISTLGLLVGLGLGWMFARVVHAAVPLYPTGNRNMSLVPMSFDARVGLYTALLAGVTAVVAGVAPAVRQFSPAARRSVHALASVRDSFTGRTARTILALEVALATVILTGTALVGFSAWRFLHQPLGFDPAFRERFSAALPSGIGPASGAAALAVQRQLRSTLAAVPGVKAVSFANGRSAPAVVDGRPLRPAVAYATRVDGEYFAALDVPLLRGRTFTQAEGETDALVAIVDERLAARVWPGVDPLGQRISEGTGLPRTVIGVVPHLRWRLTQDTVEVVYVPLDPTRPVLEGLISTPGLGLTQARDSVIHAGEAVVGPRHIGVFDLSDGITLRDAGEYRFQGPIVAGLGTVAFLLAAIGVYGLVTYLVEQRVREFGVRLALGASRANLWRVILRQSVAPAAVGVVMGLGTSLWSNRFLTSLLFGVTPNSPRVLAAVAVGLLAAATAAAIRPARRVMQIDPVRVLRGE
jgi:predicted permease